MLQKRLGNATPKAFARKPNRARNGREQGGKENRQREGQGVDEEAKQHGERREMLGVVCFVC